jgi:hypothetical protein
VNIYKIVGLAAMALVVVAAFFNVPYAAPLLAIAGAVVGVTIAAEHHVRAIVSALALHAVANSFGDVPWIGNFVTALLENLGMVVAGAALLIIARNTYNRVKP